MLSSDLFVQGPKETKHKKLHAAGSALVHVILYTCCTYYTALHQIVAKITEPPVTILGVSLTIMSSAWFMLDTIQNYKTNGPWIVFNFFWVRPKRDTTFSLSH